MEPSTLASVGGATAAVVGGLLTAFGVADALSATRARRRWVRTEATVVDNVYGPGHVHCGQSLVTPAAFEIGPLHIQPHSNAAGYALVEFPVASGARVRFRSAYGSCPPRHAIGDRVVVYFDPRDPQRARIEGEGRWLTLILVVTGLVFISTGSALWLYVRN